MLSAAAAFIYSTEKFSLINTTSDFHVFPFYIVLFCASNSAYINISFFSVVKMGPMGMQRACHNIITEGRTGEMKRRKGGSTEIHCVLGVRGVCLLLEIRRYKR